MMRLLILLRCIVLLGLIGFSFPLWATLKTKTHTYFLIDEENKVLAINRKTGKEAIIPVGKCPMEMAINGDFGYVLNFGSSDLSIINLKTHKVVETIKVEEGPRSIKIHEGKAYIVCPNGQSFLIINLKERSVEHLFRLGDFPDDFIIHGAYGFLLVKNAPTLYVFGLKPVTMEPRITLPYNYSYFFVHDARVYLLGDDGFIYVVCLKDRAVVSHFKAGFRPLFPVVVHNEMGFLSNIGTDTVSVIDLKTSTLRTNLTVGKGPQPMVIYRKEGYIACSNANKVAVVDLKTLTVKTVLDVDPEPRGITLYKTLAYVMCVRSGYVHIFDLETKKLCFKIKVEGRYPSDLEIMGDFGCVSTYMGLFVIDLQTNTILKSIAFPDNKSCTIVNSCLYLGTRKALGLFKTKDELCTFVSKFANASSYADCLEPKDIARLLLDQDSATAWELLMMLNDPLAFLRTQEGRTVCSHLSTVSLDDV